MTEKLVLTLIKHPLWGHILQPILVKEVATGYLSILEIAGSNTPIFSQLNDLSKKIVLLTEEFSDNVLIKSYSKEKNVADFHKKVTKDTIEKLIRPFIEGYQQQIINILYDSQLPLYLREGTKIRNLYETDRVNVTKDLAQVVFNFVKDDENGLRYFIRVKWQDTEFGLNGKPYIGLCSEQAVLVIDKNLLIFDDIDIKKLNPFFLKHHINIPEASEKVYIKTFILNCLEKYEVKSEGIEIHESFPEKQALLSLENDLTLMPVFILSFKYGGESFLLDTPFKKIVTMEEHDGKTSLLWFYPDKKWEKSMTKLLLDSGLKKTNINHFSFPTCDLTESSTNNISTVIEWMRLNSAILSKFDFSQNISDRNYFTGEISINTNVESKQDWFDVHCEAIFGEFKIPFARFRNNILKNIREFILPDESIAILPLEWFSRYYEMMLFSKKSGDTIRLKKWHYKLIDSLEEKNLKTLSYQIDQNNLPTVPEELCAELRKYQQTGFSWLIHLYKNNFGGCLADDMGLGKTLQTIALLQYISNENKIAREAIGAQTTTSDVTVKTNSESDSVSDSTEIETEIEIEQINNITLSDIDCDSDDQLLLFDDAKEFGTKTPSLIVMPTSLLHNWQNELKRFAPQLRVHVYSGSKRLKSIDINKVFRFFDVVLTTYGTLRNDIELLQACQFHHLILDESQYVKNPDSLSYKAVKQINSLHKLALTGTPVENSLSDLWAQLNIVNDGMLGSYTAFRNAYINPINNNNKEKEDILLRMIQPFILRRTKIEVAPELPPLTEETVCCDMSEMQEKFYNVEKNRLRNSLTEGETGKDIQKKAFLTLQGLTRLRLLANHPVMMDPSYDGGSGKFDQIIMRFETLKSGGHKVLIFSTFVKHLRILADHFDNEKWKYAWLSGSTPAADREKEINKFVEDPEVNCFFISLKAGGVGLNLTAADYVFIIDPWWNPAAEMQALSRSHRIGQDKNVMVYRFISTNSIEEKIRRLQEGKSKLAETFITSNNPLSGMNSEEMSELID